MSDLISRAEAIEAVANALWHYPNEQYRNFNDYGMSEALAKDALSALPSADAMQGVGKYENAMQKLREMPKYFNGVKAKQIKKIPSEAVQGETGQFQQARKKIYIAGPVTGVEGYEETFAKAADDLRARGYEPVNPVAPGIVEGYSYRDYINRGFQMLMECDGMLLLPGYMESKGAALELHYALAVGMEIMTGGAIK